MEPGSRRGKTTRKARKPRRSHYKKKLVKPEINIQKTSAAVLEDLPSNSTISKIDGGFDDDIEGVVDDISSTTASSPCSTPKAQRFRIPEMDKCPPAPKKQRSVPSNCSLKRTPIAFFAPPELELFFFFAFRDISV